MAKAYRNSEERVYLKVLKPLLNMEAYQLGNLEEQEERLARAKDIGGNTLANATTNAMGMRREVLYIQKLLAAVRSCEPGVCRGEEPTKVDIDKWSRKLR